MVEAGVNPRIETMVPQIIVGKRIQLTSAENSVKTTELWRYFMPRRKNISNIVNGNLLSIQRRYTDTVDFNADTVFEKWAAVPVSRLGDVPDGLEVYTLQGGLYAVFIHRGTANDFSTHQYILNEWLPNSSYVFDNREQFEIMDEYYNPNDPHATEEVWIPIRPKDF